MKPTLPLSAPPPGFDTAAQELFTAEGAPAPAGLRLQLVACPAPRSGPQRYRMPLWRRFAKRG